MGEDGFERQVVIFFLRSEPPDIKPFTETCIWLITNQTDQPDSSFLFFSHIVPRLFY